MPGLSQTRVANFCGASVSCALTTPAAAKNRTQTHRKGRARPAGTWSERGMVLFLGVMCMGHGCQGKGPRSGAGVSARSHQADTELRSDLAVVVDQGFAIAVEILQVKIAAEV